MYKKYVGAKKKLNCLSLEEWERLSPWGWAGAQRGKTGSARLLFVALEILKWIFTIMNEMKTNLNDQ